MYHMGEPKRITLPSGSTMAPSCCPHSGRHAQILTGRLAGWTKTDRRRNAPTWVPALGQPREAESALRTAVW
jgi:hypothetical protein